MKISKKMAKLVKRSLIIELGSGLHSDKFAEIIAELAIHYSTILKDFSGTELWDIVSSTRAITSVAIAGCQPLKSMCL